MKKSILLFQENKINSTSTILKRMKVKTKVYFSYIGSIFIQLSFKDKNMKYADDSC